MKPLQSRFFLATATFAALGLFGNSWTVSAQTVRETSLEASNKLPIKVRMEGPYSADTPLQIVCYFEHKSEGDKTLGAAVELDKKLGGVIGSLRERREFEGNALETLLLSPPKDTIKPRLLLLIGLGDEASLSLERMEQVGKVALREAAKLRVPRAAFAPILRDQGNAKFRTGDVEKAVTKGVLLAYDTEKRLQQEGLSQPWTLEDWTVEAGPDYFDETVLGIQKAITNAKDAIDNRGSTPYQKAK